ncbi:hypothetical protein [Klebsiella pneumoniae]|uniref:hypothetical protein n=1 Tax=Klebsiella pneumoniae TaxID=573 RepID=UPI003EDE98BF
MTRNQFNDFNGRVLIENEYGTLAGLMKKIKRIDPSDVIERKEHGFPQPVLTYPTRYSRKAVVRWIEEGGVNPIG